MQGSTIFDGFEGNDQGDHFIACTRGMLRFKLRHPSLVKEIDDGLDFLRTAPVHPELSEPHPRGLSDYSLVKELLDTLRASETPVHAEY